MTAHPVDRLWKALRSTRPPVLLGALFFVSLLARCSSTTSGASGMLSSGSTGSASGTSGASGSVECDSANAQTSCNLPRSTCDADGQTLVYYTTPTCVSGHCQWTRATLYCSQGCFFGACSMPIGTYMPPPPLPTPDAGDAAPDVTSPGDDASVDSGSGDDASVDSQTEPPPFATCVGEASTCALPASVCADSNHLLYFLNARCVDGACQSDVQSQTCPGLCLNGGCLNNVTR